MTYDQEALLKASERPVVPFIWCIPTFHTEFDKQDDASLDTWVFMKKRTGHCLQNIWGLNKNNNKSWLSVSLKNTEESLVTFVLYWFTMIQFDALAFHSPRKAVMH
jgi:hypothetical protein